MELGLGPLQPDGKAPTVLGKRVQREENPQHPGRLAPKRMLRLITGQDGQGKQQQKGRGGGLGITSGVCQGSMWIMVVQCRLLAATP